MIAVAVVVAVLGVAALALVAFRWHLEFAAASKSADRQAQLEVARAAPEQLARLSQEVNTLREQVRSMSLR